MLYIRMRSLFQIEEIKSVEVKTDSISNNLQTKEGNNLKVGDFVEFKGTKSNFKDKLELGYYGFIRKSLGNDLFLVENYYFGDKKIDISNERIDKDSLSKCNDRDLKLFLDKYELIVKKLEMDYEEKMRWWFYNNYKNQY